ncbi:YybS family protein [Jeotgalibacillus aurantiacus]|uniref:YybS family protein n=1 Tax=Jeotgalibacillus aurantiacus TaxID=2763266 RepID=UPI001D0A2FDC|nr:YybS family protein [Jeotgalibacillus aurantiacus]
MDRQSTLRLTEGAILTAFFAVLLLITVYVPVISIITAFFLILPFLIYSAKYSINASLIMVGAAIGVSAIIGGIFSIPAAVAYGTTGIAMGWMVQQKKSKLTILLISSLVFLVNVVVQYAISIVVFEINVIEEFFTIMTESFNQSVTMFNNAGVDTEQVQEVWSQNMMMIELLLPTLLVFSVAVLMWITIAVNFPIAKRLKVDVPVFTPFRELTLPKSVIWYYLIVLLTALIGAPEEGTMFAYAIINLQIALELLMILQGLSFIQFYGHHKNWSKGLMVLVTILGILINPLTRILGIIDLGFDLRKRMSGK